MFVLFWGGAPASNSLNSRMTIEVVFGLACLLALAAHGQNIRSTNGTIVMNMGGARLTLSQTSSTQFVADTKQSQVPLRLQCKLVFHAATCREYYETSHCRMIDNINLFPPFCWSVILALVSRCRSTMFTLG